MPTPILVAQRKDKFMLSDEMKRDLLKVKEIILEEPKRMNMLDWFTFNHSATPACGTVACIGGWLSIIRANNLETALAPKDVSDYPTRASFYNDLRREFNLHEDDLERELPDWGSLFYTSAWPADLHSKLCKFESGTIEYAQVVAERIDRYIEEEGEDA